MSSLASYEAMIDLREERSQRGPRLVASSGAEAGQEILRFRSLPGLDGEGGPAARLELERRLLPLHRCRPSCRLTAAGVLQALEPLPPGGEPSLDLDDLLWEVGSPPAGTVACSCGAPACRGERTGFSRLPPSERAQRIQAGRVLPWLAARESRLRAVEPVFLGEELGLTTYERARVVVLPAPLEATVSYGHGTAAGPQALLDASTQVELFDEELLRPLLPEIHTMAPLVFPRDPGEAVEVLRHAAAGPLADGKLLITLGGEHTVTAGPAAAAAALYPQLGVLHLDAHLDLRASYEGSPYSHACVVRRLVDDLGLPVVSVGIRSFSGEEAELVRQRGYQPFYAHRLDPAGAWVDEVVARLPAQVYLTLDLDVLDPAELPGTGTPEPGGLRYRELLALLRAVTSTRRIVAADLVELSPLPGNHVSEFLAARLAAKLVAYTSR